MLCAITKTVKSMSLTRTIKSVLTNQYLINSTLITLAFGALKKKEKSKAFISSWRGLRQGVKPEKCVKQHKMTVLV